MIRPAGWLLIRGFLGVALFIAAGLGLPSSGWAQAQARYVGADACKNCHLERYVGWSEGLHSRMVRPVAEATDVIPTGALAGKAPFPLKSATHVIGNMHKLAFMRKEGEHMQLLPGEFDLEIQAWRPLAIEHWNPAKPDAVAAAPGGPKPTDWNVHCARCHTTGYDAATAGFSSMSVGCESCHGPGSLHVSSEGKERMVNPETLSAERANHVCAQCHSRGSDLDGGQPFPASYRPGQDLTKSFAFEKPTAGTNTPNFYGNGVARRHRSQYNEFVQSGHAEKGVRCFDCHQVHRLKSGEPSPRTRLIGATERFLLKRTAHFVCTNCHRPDAERFRLVTKAGGVVIDTHTHHTPEVLKRNPADPKSAPEKERLMCWECHMPTVMRGAEGYAVRSHTFKAPNPSDTVNFGAPNACNTCHTNRDPGWAEGMVKNWKPRKKK